MTIEKTQFYKSHEVENILLRLARFLLSTRTLSFKYSKTISAILEDVRGAIPLQSPKSDDLTEIRRALGLPPGTSEPLVGLIWRLEQRIEDLEERAKKKARYIAIARYKDEIHVGSRSFLDNITIGEGGAIFCPAPEPMPTFPSVETAMVAVKSAYARLPVKSTILIKLADTGEIVRSFSPIEWECGQGDGLAA